MNKLYERLKKTCEEKGTTITRLCVEATGNKGNLVTWKNNKGHMRSDYLLNCSKILGVSADYLLTGEKNYPDLTEAQKEMLKLFDTLSEKEQYKLIGKLEQMTEQSDVHDKEIIQNISDFENTTKSILETVSDNK